MIARRRFSLRGLADAAVQPASSPASTPTVKSVQDVQAFLLGLKQSAVMSQRPTIALQRFDVMPPDGHPIVLVSLPYVAYPAPGAAALNLLPNGSYVVPSGFNTVFNLLGIFDLGGGLVNGTGKVIWRVLVNDSGFKGMNNLQSQFGTDSQPLAILMHLVEGDVLRITVEVPNGQLPMPPGASTGARLHGFEYPVNKLT